MRRFANHPTAAVVAAAALLWNEDELRGETRFPTAVSYASDAQRSDAATVCSESVVDEDEEEEDEEDTLMRTMTLTKDTTGLLSVSRSVAPLDAGKGIAPRGSSKKKNDCRNASLLGEEDPMVSSSGEDTTDSTTPTPGDHEEGYDYLCCDRRSSTTNDADCESSLDVEANSAGMRSIHSQEDLFTMMALLDQDVTTAAVANSSSSLLSSTFSPPLSSARLLVRQNIPTAASTSGRQSPGGTIYKGRGKRRYQGRYMNLPLKRFHHNHSNKDTLASHYYSL